MKYDPAYCLGKRLAHLQLREKPEPPEPPPAREGKCPLCSRHWPEDWGCSSVNSHQRTRSHRVARTCAVVAKAIARIEKKMTKHKPGERKNNPYRGVT